MSELANTVGLERQPGKLPGPSGRFRSTYRLMKQPFEWYATWNRRYGKTFLIKALNGNVVVTSNPENIRRVLAARHDEISQFAIGTISPLIGENSVILVSGQRHKRARSLLMPPFHGEYLKGYISTMESVAQRVSSHWKADQQITVMEASLEYSLEVIIEVVFGVQDPKQILVFKQAIKDYVSSFRPIFAFTRLFQSTWLPAWKRFLKQKQGNDRLLGEQIAHARNHPDQSLGVLSMLLAARDEHGQALAEDELKEQLVTLLFAGHETTQIAIGWAMSWLHRSPEIMRRLRDELNEATSIQECLDSELLHGICMESLRLNAIVPDFLRVLEKPMELEEVDAPAGTTIGILSCLVHEDPAIYPNPAVFDPDRWTARSYKPHEFLAFGGGVRRCIGATMAIMEMKVAIATWLRRFHFRLPEGHPDVEPVHRRNLTMAPTSGIPLVITGAD